MLVNEAYHLAVLIAQTVPSNRTPTNFLGTQHSEKYLSDSGHFSCITVHRYCAVDHETT